MPDSSSVSTELIERLLSARAAGDHCPEWLNGSIDLHQALDLQLAVLDERLGAGQSIGGWKVGLTSAASREKLGADERPFGFVLKERTLETGQELAAAAVRNLSIETEMCFTVGREITDGAITPDRILDHMASVSAGFELNEQRESTVRPDFCAMITDCLTNWGIVSGPGVPVAAADALSATTITMERNGEAVFTGLSSDHCDDHAISLCRLAEQLVFHGQTLQPGQRIITGAFARFPAKPGEHWRATYSGPAFQDPASVEISIT